MKHICFCLSSPVLVSLFLKYFYVCQSTSLHIFASMCRSLNSCYAYGLGDSASSGRRCVLSQLHLKIYDSLGPAALQGKSTFLGFGTDSWYKGCAVDRKPQRCTVFCTWWWAWEVRRQRWKWWSRCQSWDNKATRLQNKTLKNEQQDYSNAIERHFCCTCLIKCKT